MATNKNGVIKMGGNSKEILAKYTREILSAENKIEAAICKYVAPERDHLKQCYSAAAADGLDKKCLKELVRRTKMDETERFEVDAYELAWFEGMVNDENETEEEIDS